MTEKTVLRLSPLASRFVLHWGEMGSRWGVNRTVAQIHALLYLAPEPLDAEEITRALGIARSNVSTSLRELQAWGIVRVVHRIGDRRDRFESMQDVWEMFRVIAEHRKKRELDPTLALLRECADEAKQAGGDAHARERIGKLLDFFETVSSWYGDLSRLPTAGIAQVLRLGARVRRFVGGRRAAKGEA